MEPNNTSEEIWISQAMRGDRAAYSRLVKAYQIPVFNLAYRMLGDAGEAEDAAQETFLRAYTHLNSYQPERKFSSWLLSIASHYCIDRLRRQRVNWMSLEDEPVTEVPGPDKEEPEDVTLSAEARDEVRSLLDTLEPAYRQPLVLRYWYDQSYEEIARTMGISEAAVKSRLHRAREQLAARVREPQGALQRLPRNRAAEVSSSGLGDTIKRMTGTTWVR